MKNKLEQYEIGLEKLPKKSYLVRMYRDNDNIAYSGAITLAYRKEGEYELLGWSRSNVPIEIYEATYQREMLRAIWLKCQLEILNFKCLTATFESRKLPLFNRLFRKYFDFNLVGEQQKIYNGQNVKFTYVRFKLK